MLAPPHRATAALLDCARRLAAAVRVDATAVGSALAAARVLKDLEEQQYNKAQVAALRERMARRLNGDRAATAAAGAAGGCEEGPEVAEGEEERQPWR
jgi:hypothetical protein